MTYIFKTGWSCTSHVKLKLVKAIRYHRYAGLVETKAERIPSFSRRRVIWFPPGSLANIWTRSFGTQPSHCQIGISATSLPKVCFRSISISHKRLSSVMFEATCHQFCQATGRESLLPVMSVEEADDILPLQVVVKTVKRHYIFWEKAKYYSTEYQLSQLLIDHSTLNVPLDTKLLLNYNRTTNFSLGGKFGSKFIDELLDINLEAADSVSVKASFGDVNKVEADVPRLQEELEQRKVDLHHDFVQQIRQNKKKVLCVIKSVAKLANQASLSKNINVKGKASVEEKLMDSANAETSFEFNGGRDMVLPKETPIAYSVCELQISTTDGSIELILGQGLHGGFKKSVGFDATDSSTVHRISDQQREILFLNNKVQLQEVRNVLKPILCLSREQRQKLTDSLLQLMLSLDDINRLCVVLERVDCDIHYEVPVAELESKFIACKDAWMEIMKTAGFSINEKKNLSMSATKMTELEAISCVFDVMEELETSELNLIRNCQPESATFLLDVLQQALGGTQAIPESANTQILMSDDAAKQLLLHLGFSLTDNVITSPHDLPVTLDEVYWVVYALWGK